MVMFVERTTVGEEGEGEGEGEEEEEEEDHAVGVVDVVKDGWQREQVVGTVGDDFHKIDLIDSDRIAKVDLSVCSLSYQSTWVFFCATLNGLISDALTDLHRLTLFDRKCYCYYLMMWPWSFWMVVTNQNSRYLRQCQLRYQISSKLSFVVLQECVSTHSMGCVGVEGTLVCLVDGMDGLHLIGTPCSFPHAS